VDTIIRRARWLDTLDRHLCTRLPVPLNQHARLGNVEGKTLVYLVDSPIWHARLRLSSESLLDAARGIGLDVTTLCVRTARQPFGQHAHSMAAIDACMRRKNGTTQAEAHALAEIRELLFPHARETS